MKNAILNNPGLKLLALLLAVATWFYIVVELNKGAVEEKEALQRILPYKMIAKRVPIRANFTGEPRGGYRIEYDKVTIEPSCCVIIGPRSLLYKVSSLKTEPIDISEYTKTFVKDLSIALPAKGTSIKEKFVTISVPVSKKNY